MIKVTCPICERSMEGESAATWPEYPFCCARCRLIDLGRWLGGVYRIEPEVADNSPEGVDEPEIP